MQYIEIIAMPYIETINNQRQCIVVKSHTTGFHTLADLEVPLEMVQIIKNSMLLLF